MYSRKSVGRRREPWGTAALTGYSCEDFPSGTTRSRLLLRKEEIKLNIWPEIPCLEFVKNSSIPNRVESLAYSKCYSSSSPRPVKSPSNSIRYNCEKICSWSRRPKTIQEIRKKATFLSVVNNSIIYKFFKDFTNNGKKTNGAVVSSCRPFPNILKYRDHRWSLLTIWKTTFFQTLIEEFN